MVFRASFSFSIHIVQLNVNCSSLIRHLAKRTESFIKSVGMDRTQIFHVRLECIDKMFCLLDGFIVTQCNVTFLIAIFFKKQIFRIVHFECRSKYDLSWVDKNLSKIVRRYDNFGKKAKNIAGNGWKWETICDAFLFVTNCLWECPFKT